MRFRKWMAGLLGLLGVVGSVGVFAGVTSDSAAGHKEGTPYTITEAKTKWVNTNQTFKVTSGSPLYGYIKEGSGAIAPEYSVSGNGTKEYTVTCTKGKVVIAVYDGVDLTGEGKSAPWDNLQLTTKASNSTMTIYAAKLSVDKDVPEWGMKKDASIEFSDALSGVKSVTIDGNKYTESYTGSRYSVRFEGYDDEETDVRGVHKVTVYDNAKHSITVADKAGNQITTELYDADIFAPSVIVDDDKRKVEVNDTWGTGIAYIEIDGNKINGGAAADGVTWSAREEYTPLLYDKAVIGFSDRASHSITAVDKAGNKQTGTVKAAVDEVAPNVLFVSERMGGGAMPYLVIADADVSWTNNGFSLSNAGIGLKSVEYAGRSYGESDFEEYDGVKYLVVYAQPGANKLVAKDAESGVLDTVMEYADSVKPVYYVDYNNRTIIARDFIVTDKGAVGGKTLKTAKLGSVKGVERDAVRNEYDVRLSGGTVGEPIGCGFKEYVISMGSGSGQAKLTLKDAGKNKVSKKLYKGGDVRVESMVGVNSTAYLKSNKTFKVSGSSGIQVSRYNAKGILNQPVTYKSSRFKTDGAGKYNVNVLRGDTTSSYTVYIDKTKPKVYACKAKLKNKKYSKATVFSFNDGVNGSGVKKYALTKDGVTYTGYGTVGNVGGLARVPFGKLTGTWELSVTDMCGNTYTKKFKLK